jgi:hypothetical protein
MKFLFMHFFALAAFALAGFTAQAQSGQPSDARQVVVAAQPSSPAIEVLQKLKKQLSEQLGGADRDAIGQAVMEVSNAYRTAISELLGGKPYDDDKIQIYLTEWKSFIDANSVHLSKNGQNYASMNYHSLSGLYKQLSAWYTYTYRSQYQDALRTIQEAESHSETALALISKVDVPPEVRQGPLHLLEANLNEARGMKSFLRGEHELEIGALDRAIISLTASIQALKSARIGGAQGQDNPVPDFVCLVTAALKRAISDRALIAGDFNTAAQAEADRATEFDACLAAFTNAHIANPSPVTDYFRGRFIKDADVARERHDRFLEAASTATPFAWRSALFFVFAVAPLVILTYLKRNSDWLNDRALVIALFVYFWWPASDLAWSLGSPPRRYF